MQRWKSHAPKRLGPKASVLAIKLYHLLAVSLKPCFTKPNHHLVIKQFDSGYSKNYLFACKSNELREKPKEAMIQTSLEKKGAKKMWSSFNNRGCFPGISRNLGVKSKLPPRSGSSLKTVKPYP